MNPTLNKNLLRLQSALSPSEYWEAALGLAGAAAPCGSLVGAAAPFGPVVERRLFRSDTEATGCSEAEWVWKLQESALAGYVQSHPEARGVRLASLWSEDEPGARKDPFYGELMRAEKWAFVFVLIFRSQTRVHGLLVLQRTKEQGDFSREERRFLEETVHPHLDVSLSRVRRFQEERLRAIALRRFALESRSPLVLLDWDLRVVFANPEARAVCRDCFSGADAGAGKAGGESVPVPPRLERECIRLKAAFGKNLDAGTGIAANHVDGVAVYPDESRSVLARIRIVEAPVDGVDGILFEVSFRRLPDGPNASRPGEENSVFDRLSAAERDAVRLVCQGLSNKEAAACLGKSAETIKKQLTAVYDKLRIPGRGRLIALYGRESMTGADGGGTPESGADGVCRD